MPVGLHIKASAPVPATADLPAIIAAAGGKVENARYVNGVLEVRGVTQLDLDTVLSGGLDLLHSMRASKIIALDAQLEKQREAGMPWQGKVLQLHEEALSDINRMITAALAGVFPSTFAWRMKDNTFLPMDAAGMTAMGTAALGRMNALLMHYWTLKDSIRTAPDEAALNAVDVAADWPPPTTA
jgi:hypothetical protein